jgi:hypothetical protein
MCTRHTVNKERQRRVGQKGEEFMSWARTWQRKMGNDRDEKEALLTHYQSKFLKTCAQGNDPSCDWQVILQLANSLQLAFRCIWPLRLAELGCTLAELKEKDPIDWWTSRRRIVFCDWETEGKASIPVEERPERAVGAGTVSKAQRLKGEQNERQA